MQNRFQKENIGLLDIVDLKFLQNFQDAFAQSVNIASIMVDSDGPITTPSNFSDFCMKCTRGSELGYKRCNECDIEGGKIASKQGKPVIYNCHSGLTDLAVPIMVNGKHIASILGGQILTKEPDEDHFRKTAQELGIDENEYIRELRKIKIIPVEQVEAAAKLLFVVANSISEMASINLELSQKSQKEKDTAEKELLLRKISENIRSSLDINETLSYICDELARTFGVQRATIIQYHDDENYSKFEVRREYKSDTNIKGILSNPSFNFKVGEIWAKALEEDGKCLVVDDIQQSDFPDFFKENYASIDQKSIAIAPIKKGSMKWGVIILSEYNYCRHWTEDDITLLNIISNQIYMAINQSELYLTIQKKATSENVLRKIISSSVNNFNTKEIINSVVKETCQLFDADRCLFVEYNQQETSLKSYSEYLSSSDIVPASKNIPEQVIIDSMITLIEEKEILISYDVTKDKLFQETKDVLINHLSVKSFLVVPVCYGEIGYGAIILHYVKERKNFNSEEIELIKTIANQSAAIIHQAKLYSTIKKNEKYTRTVLNNIQDGIITVDDDFIIESCNPSVETIWGYQNVECVGKLFSILLDYNYDDFKKFSSIESKPLYGVKKNGEKFPVEVNMSKVVTGDKKFNLLVVRDITERKKIDQMKNEFISTVSHELRTPLTSIRGSLGLVIGGKMGDLSDKMKSLLDIANNNCLRLINLINDILDIEKIEAGKMDFEIKTVELIPVIEHTIQANIQYAKKFGVEVKLIKGLEKVFVRADGNRLIQVITNLLSNAIKFTDSALPVEVSITKFSENNGIRVSITNYGAEIPPEFKKRIFNKFAQADSSDARQKGGTGLGLSISKAIIEEMHGSIGFTSASGKTTFYFDLLEFLEQDEGQLNEKKCFDM